MQANRRKKSELGDDEILARTFISAPCAVPWDSMEGDERIKFCNHCQLNVYNISEMSKREAGALIRRNEGRLCLRLYRRSDGTIMTENCPVGLRRIRNVLRVVALALLMPIVLAGFIDHADAQGLVGAPIDAHGGQMNEIDSSVMQEIVARSPENLKLTIMQGTMFTSLLGVLGLTYLKRLNWASFGVVAGIALVVVGTMIAVM